MPDSSPQQDTEHAQPEALRAAALSDEAGLAHSVVRFERIRSAISTGSERIAQAAPGNLPGIYDQILGEIAEVVGQRDRTSRFLHDLQSPLSSLEYVIPPELEPHFDKLVAFIRSREPVQKFPHSGFLLHGPSGTGKTQFPRRLASEIGDDAIFVSIDAGSIRGEENSALALVEVLQALEKRAVQDGRTVVALIDEFDMLILAGGKTFSSKKTTVQNTASSNRSSEHRVDEAVDSMDLSEKGMTLLNTLKSQAGETLTKVFLIVTSNLDEFPSPLMRGGRFQEIYLGTFALRAGRLKSENYRNDRFPVYDDYRYVLPRIVQLLQTAHYRLHQSPSKILDALSEDVSKFFSEQEALESYINGTHKVERHGYDQSESIFPEKNFELLKAMVSFFGLNWTPLYGGSMRGPGRLEFSGELDREGRPYLTSKIYFELLFLYNLTPAQLGTFYGKHEALFTNKKRARKIFGAMIFPQLRTDPSLNGIDWSDFRDPRQENS